MSQGVGHMGDERGGLGVDLAPLEAEATVDAVVPIPEAPVGDGDGSHPGLDPSRRCAPQEDLAVPADRLGGVGVGMRVSPGPGLPRDRKLLFDLLVVRAEVLVGDRPVRTAAVLGEGPEVGGVEPRHVTGVVHHGPAHAPAGVVRPERHRIRAGDDPGFIPIEAVRPELVAHPVGVGIPERSRIQGGDPPPGPGQALEHRGPAGAAADDDGVEHVPVVEPPHVTAKGVVGPLLPGGKQPGRLISSADGVGELCRHGEVLRSSVAIPPVVDGDGDRNMLSSPGGLGSSWGTSQCSSFPTPRA